MKRKIAWFLSAVMMFSSVPATSMNVLAESIQQTTASQTEEELSVQAESENNPAQTVSSEDFADNADAVETDLEEDEELSEDEEQEVETDSDFSDGAAAEDSDGEDDNNGDSHDESEEVYLGENILDITTGKTLTWKFTAPEEGTYKFHASSDMSFYMTSEDDYMHYADGDSDETGQFVEWDLGKDENCYIEIEADDEDDDSGQLKLIIKKICENHVPLAGSAVVTEPTCEENGYTTYTCQVCGETYTDDYVEATGHQYEETGKRKPTCDEEGYTIYTCKICGDEEQDDYVDPLGHQYKEIEMQDATCTEEGYIRYICNVCRYSYDESISPYHHLDESGICTVCQIESPYKIRNAELTNDEDTYVGFEYDAEEDCLAYIEIYEEESDELIFKDCTYIDYNENNGKIYVDVSLPKYYIIKAYLSANDHVISNTYVNLFHTKAFDDLDNYVPDYKDEHTVDLKDGNYGVFAEDTVIIHGNASENTLTDTSTNSDTYILTNTDDQAKIITQDCDLAYFYDDELKLVVHVDEVTWLADKTVSFTVSQPVLEEVFESLRIDSVIQNEECTVDLSNLPAGVSYGSATSSLSAQNTMNSVSEEGLDAVGSGEANETKTTLSASQNYSFTAVKINNSTEIDGDISIEMKFPVKLYITDSVQMLQFGVDASLNGSISVKGEGSKSIPLGGYYVPVMNGIMYLGITPGFKLSADGSVSLKFGSKGNIQMQQDNSSGFQILSKDFNNNNSGIQVEGNFFVGVELKPELFLVPKNKLITTSLSLGPQFTATLTTPIPKEKQKPGDHTCQSCIEGEGNLIAELEAKVTAFKKEAKSATTFKLKGYEFYYSFDHATGNRGKCPYIKEEDPENPETPENPDDEWYNKDGTDETISVNYGTYWIDYDVTLYSDGTCKVSEAYSYKIFGDDRYKISLNEFTIPSYLYYENYFYAVRYIDGRDYEPVTSVVQHLTIPETVEKIRNLGKVFDAKKISFSGVRKTIDKEAFACCYNLESIEWPDGLKTIEEYAFSCCYNLKEFIIPDSVTTVGSPILYECTALKRLVIGKNVEHVGQLSELYAEETGWKYFGSVVEEVVLSEGISTIEGEAFRNYQNLKKITMPSTVTIIDGSAFEDCTSLSEIIWPENLETIGWDAFKGCISLKSVILPEHVKEVDHGAFERCTSLNWIYLPDSVTEVGYAFEDCGNEITITIGSNVKFSKITDLGFDSESIQTVSLKEGRTKIEEDAFNDCTNLKTVNIPDSVNFIGSQAFSDCSSLEEIHLPDGLLEMEYSVFRDCTNLKTCILPDNMEKCGGSVFWGCSSLTEVHIPLGITAIPGGMFVGCSSLTDILIPSNITVIEGMAFEKCIGLKNMTIPDSVKHIAGYVFEDCSELKSIIIPDSVEDVGYGVFSGCSNLTELTIGKNVKMSRDNRIWDWGCALTLTTVHLSSGREKIEDYVFGQCTRLTTITIPDSVTSIGEWAFHNCCSLSSVTISGNVTSIGERAFYGCSSLKEVIIPMGVKKIGAYAFCDCNSLTSVTISDSVEEMGDAVFYLSDNIKKMTIGKNIDLEHMGYGHAENIYLTEGRTEIQDYAFFDLSSLKSITLPESLEKIGKAAFMHCSGLESICLPDGVKTIEANAFQQCVNLSDITMPDSVEEIGDGAFSGCSALKKVVIPPNTKVVGEGVYYNCTSLSQAVIAGKDTDVKRTSFSDSVVNPNLKIYGLSGSNVEKVFSGDTRFVSLEAIDKEGHGYVTDHVITPSTCSTPGEYVLKCIICENCGKTYTAEMPVSDNHEKIEKTPLVQASMGTEGKTEESYCIACGKTIEEGETIPAIKTVMLSQKSCIYNGKVQKPAVIVTDSMGNKLTGESYSVKYAAGCTDTGTYAVKVTFRGNYKGSKSLSYRIDWAEQNITVKTSSKTYTYTTVKAKAQTFSIGASAKTALSYKSSNTKYVTVDKNGKVTMKKGTPGGTYTVTVTAAQNKNYNKASKTVVIKISQAAQSIKTKVSSKTYKYAAVKKGKQTFSIGASAKTTLSYKSSNTKYVTVNKKGEVTIKKGTPKGTYKITVKAAKNAEYKEATKTVTIKIS